MVSSPPKSIWKAVSAASAPGSIEKSTSSAPAKVVVRSPSEVILPMLVKSPVVETSQSEELICSVSPPSPIKVAPPGVKVKAPVVVKVVEAPSKAMSVSAKDALPFESRVPERVRATPVKVSVVAS